MNNYDDWWWGFYTSEGIVISSKLNRDTKAYIEEARKKAVEEAIEISALAADKKITFDEAKIRWATLSQSSTPNLTGSVIRL